MIHTESGVVDAFLAGQQTMSANGDDAVVEELLAGDVAWHVPGTSPIAGDFGGRAAVLRYLRFRRTLAGETTPTAKRVQASSRDRWSSGTDHASAILPFTTR